MIELRKEELLKATYKLLKKCYESHYISNVMAETVFYDNAECDGYCLMNDIAIELNLEEV